MDRNELETYQVQLSQVELALRAEPTSTELLTLRDELKELISMTEAALAQMEVPASSSSIPPSSNKEREKKKNGVAAAGEFKAGDECMAKYTGDGAWYPARVTSVGGSEEKRVYSVVFKGYNSTELLGATSLKPLPANASSSGFGTGPGAGASASAKRKATTEEDLEKERKKKKNEKKLETRAAKSTEQNNKQAAWQKFAKKGEKKGIHIAGVAGTSIFKTPDNPYGRGTCALLCLNRNG
jgi:survival of motor neuron-related-splicing factor 30